MNILITGGSGFVGHSIKEWFGNNTTHYIFTPLSSLLNLYNLDDISNYLLDNNIEIIIHSAFTGTRSYLDSRIEDVYYNLLMVENILCACTRTSKEIPLINFGSGREYGINSIQKACEYYNEDCVPTNYYGFTKSLISKRLSSTDIVKAYNLRFWGGFGYYENNDRFIKKCILNIINDKDIVIKQNRLFDYIYIDDLAIIINSIINGVYVPINLNCVYENKYTLVKLANIIKRITGSTVKIIVEHQALGEEYTGNGNQLKQLNLPLIGLDQGIKIMYQKLLQENI